MHALVNVFFLGGIRQNAKKKKKKVAGERPLIKNWTKKMCCHILTLSSNQ